MHVLPLGHCSIAVAFGQKLPSGHGNGIAADPQSCPATGVVRYGRQTAPLGDRTPFGQYHPGPQGSAHVKAGGQSQPSGQGRKV